MKQDLIIFDIKGKFGHFKKFYTNASSLTYLVPPRTTIAGMIASIMEMPRDSYYEELNTENSDIGIRILRPAKKHIECMNYIRYKQDGGYTQTRLELLLSQYDLFGYRIYFKHKDNDFLKRFENKIKDKNLGYGLYLGQRPFIAGLELVERISKEKIKNLNNFNFLNTVTSLSNVVSPIITRKGQEYIRERMPISFERIQNQKTGSREMSEVGDFLIETTGKPLIGEFREGYQIVYKSGEKENICFLKK